MDTKRVPADLTSLLAGADDAALEQLIKLLERVWFQRRRAVDARWKRTLPFGDYVVDRWQRARELGFGEGSSIYDSVVVLGEVDVGERTWVGPFVVLDGSGGLRIGSNCSIAAGVQIYSHDTVKWATSGGHAPYEHAPTSIGNNCYVGPNTIVAMGVSIGDGCTIGANSFVDCDIPAGATAHGTPCRVSRAPAQPS